MYTGTYRVFLNNMTSTVLKFSLIGNIVLLIILLVFPPRQQDSFTGTEVDTLIVYQTETVIDTVFMMQEAIIDTVFIESDTEVTETTASTNVVFSKDNIYTAWLRTIYYMEEEKFEFDFKIEIEQETKTVYITETITRPPQTLFLSGLIGGSVVSQYDGFIGEIKTGVRLKERLDLYLKAGTDKSFGVGFMWNI